MRISDWSSDVCSSDLLVALQPGAGIFGDLGLQQADPAVQRQLRRRLPTGADFSTVGMRPVGVADHHGDRAEVVRQLHVLVIRVERVAGQAESGSASSRDSVCEYV